MEINSKACNPGNYGGTLKTVQYIVVHWTSNQGDTAKNNADYFAREVVKASAHYFVDENEVWNSVSPDRQAWHVGAKSYTMPDNKKRSRTPAARSIGYVHPYCRNSNSIGVEMCLTGKGYVLRRGTIERAVKLVRELMARYGVPLQNVVRHYDVTGKDCPGPFVENPSLWDDFKAALAAEPEEEMKVYKYVPEMPIWAQDTFTRLVQAGYIAKDDKGEIEVQESSLQPLVYMDRLLGGKIEKLPELMKNIWK